MKDKKMKLTKFANLLVIGLVLTVVASGCRKKPVGVTKLPNPRTGPVQDASGSDTMKPVLPVTDEGGRLTGTELTGHVSNPVTLHEGWIEDA